MKNKFRKQKLVADINITPFTDVILVLLVIFMISTPLMYQTSLKVRLPEAKGDASSQISQKEVRVTITNENLVYLDNAIVSRKELKTRLQELHKETKDLKVVLYADRLVQFKDIIEILDVLNEEGISKLDIAAVKRQ